MFDKAGAAIMAFWCSLWEDAQQEGSDAAKQQHESKELRAKLEAASGDAHLRQPRTYNRCFRAHSLTDSVTEHAKTTD